MKMMWEGRFSKPVSQQLNDFNASLPFDWKLYRQDIQGSLAHAEMLVKQQIISEEDGDAIAEGLKQILQDIEDGTIDLAHGNYEDIHMAIEQILTERIGDAGKRLHTGRSRNDQVALDMRMYVRDSLHEIRHKLLDLLKALISSAQEGLHAIMPGYTHLQRAQPITFGHVMMAYASMIMRDIKRIDHTIALMNESPLGSCALAGTTYPLDRDYTADVLGFDGPCMNSLDGVSDRDYIVEGLADLSIIMVHLSRLSEEVVAWCSWEFKFIELDDAYATGSSIMPQKKNPDICELVRSKSGRVFGDLMQMLTMLKGLPLAYNKDMQEDKESWFDACDTVLACLSILPAMLETMTLLTENMENAAAKGYINATDLADYLTKKGMPFRDAYKITGQIVGMANSRKISLNDLSLEELQAFSPMIEEDVFAAIDLKNCVAKRSTKGGPAPVQVQAQIDQAQAFIVEEEALVQDAY